MFINKHQTKRHRVNHGKSYSGKLWATSIMALASGLALATVSGNTVLADTTTPSTTEAEMVTTSVQFYLQGTATHKVIVGEGKVQGMPAAVIDANQVKAILPPGYALAGEITQKYSNLFTAYIPVVSVPVTNQVQYVEVLTGAPVATGKQISGTYDTAVTPTDIPNGYTLTAGQALKFGPDGSTLTIRVQKIITHVTNKISYIDATSGAAVGEEQELTGVLGDIINLTDLPDGYYLVPGQTLQFGADGSTVAVKVHPIAPGQVSNKVEYVDDSGDLIQKGQPVTGKLGDPVTPTDIPSGYALVPNQTLNLGADGSTLKVIVKQPNAGNNDNSNTNGDHSDPGSQLGYLVATIPQNAGSVTVYDQPNGQATGKQLPAGSSWKAFRTYTDDNGAIWYNLGGQQWIRSTAVILAHQTVPITPVNALGKVAPDVTVPVYTNPGLNAKPTGQILAANSTWQISATAMADGQLWLRVRANQWIKSTDVKISQQQGIRGIATIKYLQGYGINVWSDPAGKHFTNKRLPNGSAWQVFAKATNFDGHVFYNVGRNQWLDSAYVSFLNTH